MLTTLQRRVGDERGFTLIEILVVILIIGILAAIAIPSFITQKDKASDSGAKSFARHLQTAQEAYYTDNNAYANALSALQRIEPSLNNAPNPGGRSPDARNTPSGGFTVTATSTSGVTYTVSRDSRGVTARTCDRPNVAGCNSGSSW
jgi:type IV pilus assembly protein PilA